MASVTFALPEHVKTDMKQLSWVNWSEDARQEVKRMIAKEKALEKIRRLVSKSKLTEKDADMLAREVKRSMGKRLQKEGWV